MTMRILLAYLMAALILAQADKAMAGETGIRALPVPVNMIYPGDILSAADLTERQFQTSPQSLQGIALEADQVIGKAASRRLPAGKPIPLSGVGKPLSVHRGAPAVAFYREDGFSISTAVIALEDGAVGDIIDARAKDTGAVIRVEVLASGELAVLTE